MTAPPFPFRLGGFGCIACDPPWHYEDQAGRMRLAYPTMTDDEIVALPVATLAADRAHLYLWTTDAHLEVALRCIPAWGFVFKRTLVWVKTNAKQRILKALDAIELDEKDRATQLVHGALKLQIGGGPRLPRHHAPARAGRRRRAATTTGRGSTRAPVGHRRATRARAPRG